MAKSVAELIQVYEDALSYWETADLHTRDWGGIYDQPSRDIVSAALAQAEDALVAALDLVGPVTHRGRDYRLYILQTREIVSEAGRRLLIGPPARNAEEVSVP
jgi:hypothetical protein